MWELQSMARQRKASSRPPEAHEIIEADLAQDKMGKNSLQGDDQSSVRNERHAEPDMKPEADDLMETFEKSDKDVRARRDLGKGRRHSPKHPFNKPE